MKKILESILTVLLLFACVSCGDNGDNGNTEDAQTFFDKIGTANYNVKKLDSVVVYGKSDSIDALK